jgi:ABC-type Fe3+ transport system permease subunit
VSTAVLATLIGVPLGVALARIDLPWKPTLRVLLAAPMLLPPYVAALAWVSLGGGTGLLAEYLGRDLLSAWTFSLPGAVLVLALVFYPLSMLATEVAVRRIEPRLEEAALIVTSPRQVLWRVTLPLAAPGITAAALLIFVLAASEFGVPGLLCVRLHLPAIGHRLPRTASAGSGTRTARRGAWAGPRANSRNGIWF